MALSLTDIIPGCIGFTTKGIEMDFDKLIDITNRKKVDVKPEWQFISGDNKQIMVSATTVEGMKFYSWIPEAEWKEFCQYNNLCHKCGAELEEYAENNAVWKHCNKGCIDPEFIRYRGPLIPARRSSASPAANLSAKVEFCK